MMLGLCKDCSRRVVFRTPTLLDPDGGDIHHRCTWSNKEILCYEQKCSHFERVIRE